MTAHLHALAMRTKAAGIAENAAGFRQKQLDENMAMHWQDQDAILRRAWSMSISGSTAIQRAILALPLEADHAALVREAAALLEVKAIIDLLPYLKTAADASEPQLRMLCKTLHRLISALDTP